MQNTCGKPVFADIGCRKSMHQRETSLGLRRLLLRLFDHLSLVAAAVGDVPFYDVPFHFLPLSTFCQP